MRILILETLRFLSGNIFYVKIGISIIFILIIYATRKVITKKVANFIIKLFKINIPNDQKDEINKWLKAFEWLLVVVSLDLIRSYLFIYLPLFLATIPFKLVYMLLVGGALNGILDLLSLEMVNKSKEKETLNPTIIYMGFKVAKVIVWIIIAVMFLDELGYNISGLIAGLGIGGLAFALAAQDTVGNLFGCVVILVDKPFIIGDWIQTPNVEGVVEAITFRSTRIRTFENALVAVPNSTLANALITNWSSMEKRKLRLIFGVTYDTSVDLLKEICSEMLTFLNNLENIEEGSAMVHVETMAASSIDIRLDATILKKTGKDFLDMKEKINYGVMEILAKKHTNFAFPTSSIYIEKMPNLINKKEKINE